MKLAALFAALILLSIPAAADQRLTIRISHSAGFAPAELIIQSVVERSADNRVLTVQADSGEFFRSSAMELEGEQAARVNNIRFRQMPSGFYEVRVRVLDKSGHELASATKWVLIG